MIFSSYQISARPTGVLEENVCNGTVDDFIEGEEKRFPLLQFDSSAVSCVDVMMPRGKKRDFRTPEVRWEYDGSTWEYDGSTMGLQREYM